MCFVDPIERKENGFQVFRAVSVSINVNFDVEGEHTSC